MKKFFNLDMVEKFFQHFKQLFQQEQEVPIALFKQK